LLFSCYDVDDPEFSPAGCCQASFLGLSYAEPWMRVPPTQYHDTKYRFAESMLKTLYRVFPETQNHIEELEVGTPLTILRYLGHPGGAIYGFDQTIKDSELFLEQTSPIKGLVHTGAWAGSGGFQPTLMSGMSTANAVVNSLSQKGRK
jgi:prolycopene isomerase